MDRAYHPARRTRNRPFPALLAALTALLAAALAPATADAGALTRTPGSNQIFYDGTGDAETRVSVGLVEGFYYFRGNEVITVPGREKRSNVCERVDLYIGRCPAAGLTTTGWAVFITAAPRPRWENFIMAADVRERTVVFGSDGRDQIFTGAANDALYGAGGDDVLGGGSGADYLSGGAGGDCVSYERRTEGIRVSLGDRDRNDGNASDGPAFARDDIDTDVECVWGGAGNDILYGSANADGLSGEGGRDQIHGRGGHDSAHGGDGADFVYGGPGWDQLHGGLATDWLSGGPDTDNLEGGNGADLLDGGTGDDYLRGQAGAGDVLSGGEGNDHLYSRDNLADFVQGDAGDGDVAEIDLFDVVETVERLI